MKFISSIFKTFLIVFTTQFAFAQTASILPPAKTTFFDANGNPLVNGKVKFLVPGQTTNKTTWIDSAETTPNTNPVILDSAGRAIILGDGVYRQQVFDQNNNLIWDQLTAAGAGAGGSVAAIGDGNNIGTILPWLGTVPPSGYVFAYGQELNRVTFAALFKVATLVQNVTCVGGSPILTTIADTSQLPIGAKVEGSCIPANSTILSKTTSTVTINNNATVNITIAATFFPFGNGNGSNTFNVPDLRGKTLIARNNMGGAASSVLTSTYCGNSQDPNSLGAFCGNQSFALAMGNLPASPAPVTASTSGYTPNVGAGVPIIAVGGGSSTIQVSSPGTANANVFPSSTFFAINGFSSLSVGTNTANLGTDVPFSLMQPSLAFNYVIKTTPNITPTILNVVTSLGSQTGDIGCGANIVCSGNSIAFSGGSMAQQNANSVAITGGTITGMPSPSIGADVANKTYVDSVASGVLPLPSSDLATAAILPNTPTYANGASGVGATLTAGSNTTLTVDGKSATLGLVVLVKNQASAFQNGIYTVTTAGSGAAAWVLTRATYFDQAAEMKAGSRTFITGGLTLIGNSYSLGQTITTVGTDAVNWTLFSQAPTSVNIQARQSILSSSVNANGDASFANGGAGLNVNLTATANPLTLAFASGYNAITGAVDFIGQIAADATNFWSTLPANQYSFLSIDRNAVTGALTASQTLVRPQKGPVFYAPRQALLHLDSSNLDDWGNTWSSNGATFTAPCAKFGSAGVSLNGSSSYVQSAQIFNPGLGNWTIDVWTNLVSNVSSSIFSVGNAFGVYVVTNASGKLTLFLSSGGASWDISSGVAAGATTVTAGTFHHIALVFNGASYVLYLDGVAQLTVSSSTVIWPDGAAMAMGAQVGIGSTTAGCYDEFDFVPFARWVSAFTPPVAAYTVSGDWFDTNNMVMNTATGAGPTWTTVQRQYVAEAQTQASSISAVYDYSATKQFKGSDFALNGAGKLRVGDHVIYAEGTPQFITGSTPGTPCVIVSSCTLNAPVTWVLAPSQVPPDAKWFDIQINVFHAAIGGTNPGNQDCTLQSRIPIGTIQNFIALGAAYSNFTGFGTITNTSAFTETAGTVARFPVINGIAAFETTIGGGTCSAGGTNNQARLVTGILLGYDMP